MNVKLARVDYALKLNVRKLCKIYLGQQGQVCWVALSQPVQSHSTLHYSSRFQHAILDYKCFMRICLFIMLLVLIYINTSTM